MGRTDKAVDVDAPDPSLLLGRKSDRINVPRQQLTSVFKSPHHNAQRCLLEGNIELSSRRECTISLIELTLYRLPHSSYYDNRNRPTAALYRARQPYLVRNAITGLAIFGFVAGVCTWQASKQLLNNPRASINTIDRSLTNQHLDTWTIKAIGQDDFSDVPIPDAPLQPAAAAPHASTVRSAGKV